ncbi:MAG: hypothetical protein ACR2QA_14745 [Solirubrobacteraceae bacterium]
MLITAPTEIASAIYDGPLEPASAEARKRRSAVEGLEQINVTIGEPIGWSVSDAYHRDQKAIPGALASLLGDGDAVIVGFACTFRLPPDATVKFAEFKVELSADSDMTPIAYDLFPFRVTDDVRRNVRVALAPSLKFSELVEVTPGEVSVELEYDQIIPTIEALGAREADFSWRMRPSRGQQLAATSVFHAAVRLTRDMTKISGTCGLQADVKKGGGLLPSAHLPQNARRWFSITRDAIG